MQTTITFKAKVRHADDAGTTREYIDFKRVVTRRDCPLKPHQHAYYNSDLFPAILQRAYDKAIEGKSYFFLDAIPQCVRINRAFLCTVDVAIEV